MKNHLAIFAAATVVVVTTSSIATAQETLKWKFKKGQLLRVELTQQSDTETIIRQKPLKMTVRRAFELDWLVKEVGDTGVTQIEQSVVRAQLSMTNPNSPTLSFDSASQIEPQGQAAQLAASLKPLLGLKFVVAVDPSGELKDVQLPSESKPRVAELPPQVKDVFTSDGLRKVFQQMTTALPNQPVSAGDQWQTKRESKTRFGAMRAETTWTFAGIVDYQGKQLAKINLVTDLALQPSGGNQASTLKLKQHDLKGTIYFDTEAGRLTESQSEQTMVAEAKKKDLVIETRSKTTMNLKMRLLK